MVLVTWLPTSGNIIVLWFYFSFLPNPMSLGTVFNQLMDCLSELPSSSRFPVFSQVTVSSLTGYPAPSARDGGIEMSVVCAWDLISWAFKPRSSRGRWDAQILEGQMGHILGPVFMTAVLMGRKWRQLKPKDCFWLCVFSERLTIKSERLSPNSFPICFSTVNSHVPIPCFHM